MRTRGVVGKRIIAIEQERRSTGRPGARPMCVSAIVLEDGTRLCPVTVETDFGDYFHEIRIERPARTARLPKKKPQKPDPPRLSRAFLPFPAPTAEQVASGARCHSGSDGECNWKECPQLRDEEPAKSGRGCPLYDWNRDE
jgi:hypothetical protein